MGVVLLNLRGATVERRALRANMAVDSKWGELEERKGIQGGSLGGFTVA